MGVALICWPATPSMLLLLKAISNSALCWLTKGQTLEKIMDCLRSVHLKKSTSLKLSQHNNFTEKIQIMKPQCCHVTS